MADHHPISTPLPASQQFVLTQTVRTVLFSSLGLGVLCLLLIFFNDDPFHTRFWTNIIHNTVFFTGIALFALFKYAASVTALGGWIVMFKRIWEAYALFLIVGLILLLIIAGGLYLGYHHLYHWNDAVTAAEDRVIRDKTGFLNKNFYTLFTIIAMGTWIFLARKIRAISLDEDIRGDATFSHHIQIRKYASIALPVIGFLSAAALWLWVMSLDAHWYSTMFAWYSSASLYVSMIALTIVVLISVKSMGYLQEVTMEHFHDLGKFMFAFSIFWTYLWFSQYMLIWYSNVGEETIYFRQRFDNYKVLFYSNLILNFLLPFLILMRNDTKRKVGTLVLVSGLVFMGHWIDFFQMTKPGPLHTAHELMEQRKDIGAIDHSGAKPMAVSESTAGQEPHGATSQPDSLQKMKPMHSGDSAHSATESMMENESNDQDSHASGDEHGQEHASAYQAGFTLPGLLEIGVLIGFLSGFLLFVFREMGKAPLLPKNDPYYSESLHHHVQ